MKLLIDSHVLLWWGDASGQMSSHAASLLKNPKAEVLFSSASAWELAIKESTGKFRLVKPIEQFVAEQVAINDIHVLPVNLSHAFAVARLPWHHRDPFDRLLIAQAQVENAKIVTADSLIRKYDVETIW